MRHGGDKVLRRVRGASEAISVPENLRPPVDQELDHLVPGPRDGTGEIVF